MIKFPGETLLSVTLCSMSRNSCIRLSPLPDLFDFLSDDFGQRERLGLNPFDGHCLAITEGKDTEQEMYASGSAVPQDCTEVQHQDKQSGQQVCSLEASAREEGPAVARLASTGAECRHTAGVAVTVSYLWVAHDAAHGHETFLI